MKNYTKFIMPVRLRDDGAPDDEFHFDCIISDTSLDGHHSRMTEKTLRNYAEDCETGVPFMESHRSDIQAQIGNMFSGEFSDGKTVATGRILRDTEETPDHLRLNETIRRMERGMYSSVSIGFHGGSELCDLCQRDIWDYSDEDPCPHIPGRVYDGATCTYRIDDAHLREVSLVYRGSNPNAKVTETRDWPDELQIAKALKSSEKSQLELDGEAYREKIIAACLAEGIRSDPAFDDSVWRDRLAKWNAAAIEDQTRIFRQLGDTRFGVGGRKTTDQPKADHSRPVILPATY